MPKPSTATATDVFNALQKRLTTQGHMLSDRELLTLTIDVVNAINTDSGSALAHCASEIVQNPVRTFIRGV
jgi:hypothetical protein